MTTIPRHKASHQGRKASDADANLSGIAVIWPVQILETVDLKAEGDPAEIGAIAAVEITVGGSVDVSAAAGAQFTNDTADLQSAAVGDGVIIPATEAVGDYFLIGTEKPPIAASIDIGTAGTDGAGEWEYLASDGVWRALPNLIDGTNDFKALAGIVKMSWALPDDWAPVEHSEVTATLGGVPVGRYYLRFRVTTVYTINPVLDEMSVYVLDPNQVTNGMESPVTGVITHVHLHAGTASGNNADTVIEIDNHSKGTRAEVNLEGAHTRKRLAATKGLWVERGDVVTIRGLAEDGTAEYQNIQLGLEVQI